MKIMLIEDHKMLAQCLKMDLESGGKIRVDIPEKMKDIKDKLQEETYDLLLIDINLDGLAKGENGLKLSEALIRDYGAKVLILSGYNLDFYREKAKEMGCMGFISKEESTQSLLAKIRGVCLENKRYFSSKKHLQEKLTENELKTLRLYASGKSRKEVAKEAYMSTSSLAVLLNRIYGKLNVKNYQEMVQKAREIGYIDPF